MPRSYKLEIITFALIGFVSSFNFATNSTLFSLFAQDLGFSSQLTGILLSIFTAGSMFGAPFLGKLVDQTGKRKIILLLGIAGQGIFTLLTPITSNFWLLTLMRFLLGVCIVAQAPILNELVVALEDPQLREQSLIFLNLARSIGFSTGCMISGVLMDFSVAWNFYFSALLALGTIAPAATFIKNIDKANISSSEKSSSQKWLLEKRVLAHYLSAMLRATAVMGVLFFLPLFWQSNNQSATSSGIIIGLANLFQILFFPMASRICSRLPERSFAIALLGYTMSVVPLYIFPFSKGWSVLVPQTILSTSYVFFYIGAIFFTREIVPSRNHTEAMGWLETSINLGGAIGPVVFANFLALNGNDFPRTILLFSLFPILALSLFAFAKPEQKLKRTAPHGIIILKKKGPDRCKTIKSVSRFMPNRIPPGNDSCQTQNGGPALEGVFPLPQKEVQEDRLKRVVSRGYSLNPFLGLFFLEKVKKQVPCGVVTGYPTFWAYRFGCLLFGPKRGSIF